MRPKLPPPPLPPNCSVLYVMQKPRHKKYSDRTVTPTVFHCVRSGEPGSLCGVRPDLIRRRLLKRATMWEPEKWQRPKYWTRADFGTQVSCPTCRAMIRKAVDKLHRPTIRYRPLKPTKATVEVTVEAVQIAVTVEPPTPPVQPTVIPVKQVITPRGPGRTARVGTPPMGSPTPVLPPVPLKRTATSEMTK